MLLGLKAKISVTLVVLLFASMLLVNLVVVFFWQRSLVQTELSHIEAVVGSWYKTNSDLSTNKMFSPKSLMNLSLTIGASCENIVLFDGQTEYSLAKENNAAVGSLLRKCYLDNKPINQSVGLSWKVFTFGEKHLYHVLPLKNDNDDRHIIALVLNFDGLYRKITEKQTVIFFYIIINSIVLGAIGFFRLAKYLLRPIDKLIFLSESYTNSDEMIFSSLKGDNEFGKLSFALNSMVGKINADKHELTKNIHALEQANKQLIDSQKKMVHTEKMAAVGRLSAGLAHEVGNPVGIVQGYLELLENDDLTSEDRRQFSDRAIQELERINKMVRQLLDFSRTSVGDKAFVSVEQVCLDARGVFRAQKVSSGIEFLMELYEGMDTVGVGYDDLYQVLINCLFNAIDGIQDREGSFSGKVSISSRLNKSSSNRSCLEIWISDNGTGIPEEHLASVFDPFFTTKDVGKGTGLGLSISYAIIEAAGGVMEIESVYGKGTDVMISLPLVTLNEKTKVANQFFANG